MADIPGNITTTASMDMSLGVGTFTDQLETVGDHDFIKITLFQNSTASFYLSFQEKGLVGGDPTLRLLDSAGNVVLTDDDHGVFHNAFISFRPGVGQGGTYYLDIGAHADNAIGTYSLVATFPFGNPTNRFLTSTDDDFTGTTVNERILGGEGADFIHVGKGVDAFGEQGNDVLFGSSALQNILVGGLGSDTIYGGSNPDGQAFIFGDSGDDVIVGAIGVDTDRGGTGDDIIFGGTSDDTLSGGAGNDFLYGGLRSDILIGGTGTDVMTGDHQFDDESDTFVFNAVGDSTPGGARDVINGFFVEFDKIDLSAIDANTHTGGNQAFTFAGAHRFHHEAGELIVQTKGGNTIVKADVNGDGHSDMEIQLTGMLTLTANDFFL